MDSLGTSVFVVCLWMQGLPMLYQRHLPNNSWKDVLNLAKLSGTSSQHLLQMSAPKNYCCNLQMKPPLESTMHTRTHSQHAHSHTHTHTHTHTRVHAYTHTHMCTHMHTHTDIYIELLNTISTQLTHYSSTNLARSVIHYKYQS